MIAYERVQLTREQHDDFVKSQKCGNMMQLYNWPVVKSPSWYTRRIALEKYGEVAATAVLLFRRMPKTRFTICYIPRGCVMDFSDKELLGVMIDEIKKVAKEEHAFTIKMDPDLTREEGMDLYNYLTSKGWKHNGFEKGFRDSQPRFTMVTDIDCDEKTLLKKFQSKTKYAVRKSMHTGLTAKEYSREYLPEFSKLMDITGERDGFNVRDLDYFEKIFDAFDEQGDVHLYLTSLVPQNVIDANKAECTEIERDKKRLEKKLGRELPEEKRKGLEGECKILDGRYERCNQLIDEMEELKAKGVQEQFLAGAILVYCGEKVYYLYASSSNDFRDLLPNYLMQWTMMTHCQEIGKTSYDFGGVTGFTGEELENDPEADLYIFKKKFGADMIEHIGEFDYVLKPVINNSFKAALKVFKKLSK